MAPIFFRSDLTSASGEIASFGVAMPSGNISPIADIERASAIAERRGVGYQTVLKELIKAGLSKAS